MHETHSWVPTSQSPLLPQVRHNKIEESRYDNYSYLQVDRVNALSKSQNIPCNSSNPSQFKFSWFYYIASSKSVIRISSKKKAIKKHGQNWKPQEMKVWIKRWQILNMHNKVTNFTTAKIEWRLTINGKRINKLIMWQASRMSWMAISSG